MVLLLYIPFHPWNPIYPVLFLPVLAFVVIGILLLRSWRYEYEYVYVTEGRKNVAGCKVRDFTSGWEKGRVYTIKVGNDLIYMEPNDEFLEEMRLHRKLQ